MTLESWLLVFVTAIAVLTLIILVKNSPSMGAAIASKVPDSGLKRLLSSGKYHVITGTDKKTGQTARKFEIYEERHNQTIQDVVKATINATSAGKKVIVERETDPMEEIPLDNKPN